MLELLPLLGCCAGLRRDSFGFRLCVDKAAPMWHHEMRQSSSTAWQYAPCTPSLLPVWTSKHKAVPQTRQQLCEYWRCHAPLLAGSGAGQGAKLSIGSLAHHAQGNPTDTTAVLYTMAVPGTLACWLWAGYGAWLTTGSFAQCPEKDCMVLHRQQAAWPPRQG